MHTCILWTATDCKWMPLVFCYGRVVEKNVITRSEVEHLWSRDHQMSNLTVQNEYNVKTKTRKHSSRMRTARFCTSGGGYGPGWSYGPRGSCGGEGGTVPGGTVRGDIVGRHYLSPAPMWRDNMCKTLPSRNFVCGG